MRRQPQWSALFAGLTMTGKLPADTRAVIGIETGNDAVRLVLDHDGFEIQREVGDAADVTLRGSALLVGGVLSGTLTVDEATQLGLVVDGRAALLGDLHDNRAPAGATP